MTKKKNIKVEKLTENISYRIIDSTIYLLLNNPIKMNYIKQNSSYLAKFDATEKIIECLKSL